MERLIERWREELSETGDLSGDEIEELETHLRESIDELLRKGLSKNEAFDIASKRIGAKEEISEEYRKSQIRLTKPLLSYITLPVWLIIASLLVFVFSLNMVEVWMDLPLRLVNEDEKSIYRFEEEELAKIEKVASENSENPEIQAGAGYIFYVEHRYQQAVEYFKKSHTLAPDEKPYLLYTALSYQQSGYTWEDSVYKHLEMGRDGENAAFYITPPRRNSDFPFERMKEYLTTGKHAKATKEYMQLMDSLIFMSPSSKKSISTDRIERLKEAMRLEKLSEDYQQLRDSLIAVGQIPPLLAIKTPHSRNLGHLYDQSQREAFREGLWVDENSYSDYAQAMYGLADDVLEKADIAGVGNQWIIANVISLPTLNLISGAQYYFDDLGPFDSQEKFDEVKRDLVRFAQLTISARRITGGWTSEVINDFAFSNLSLFYGMNNMPIEADLAAISGYTVDDLYSRARSAYARRHWAYTDWNFYESLRIYLSLKMLLLSLFVLALLGLTFTMVNHRNLKLIDNNPISWVLFIVSAEFFSLSSVWLGSYPLLRILYHILLILFGGLLLVSKWDFIRTLRRKAPSLIFALLTVSLPGLLIQKGLGIYFLPVMAVLFITGLSATAVWRTKKSWVVFWEATSLYSSILLLLLVILLAFPARGVSDYLNSETWDKFFDNSVYFYSKRMTDSYPFFSDAQNPDNVNIEKARERIEKYYRLTGRKGME